MIPHPIPHEPGCVSILTHRGSYPQHVPSVVTLSNGVTLPVIGTVGTNDPNQWQHTLWIGGKAYLRHSLCDVLSHVPTLDELLHDFEANPDLWSPVLTISSGKIS